MDGLYFFVARILRDGLQSKPSEELTVPVEINQPPVAADQNDSGVLSPPRITDISTPESDLSAFASKSSLFHLYGTAPQGAVAIELIDISEYEVIAESIPVGNDGHWVTPVEADPDQVTSTTIMARAIDVTGRTSDYCQPVVISCDPVAPMISHVALADSGKTWHPGEEISLTVHFNKAVTVIGDPGLNLQLKAALSLPALTMNSQPVPAWHSATP